jgi:hypothetical protein
MATGMTHVAPEPSKRRWLVAVFGLIATTAVVYFAWAYRYGRPHIEATVPIADVPSATADLPLDDEEEDIDPAPPLASGSSSAPPPRRPKRKKPAPSTSPGPSLSAALAEIGSSTPPPPPKSSFDRAGAVVALHAVDIQKCATPDGPQGPSRLTVFYGNDGLPKHFFFDRRGPYAGTPAEMCITAQLRSAHVDPFTGPMQAVAIQINLR